MTGTNKSARSVLMTIRERPSFEPNSGIFGSFRPFGFGSPTSKAVIPNCVYANWPASVKRMEGDKTFIVLNSSTLSGSTSKGAPKTVHLQLEQDKSVERRILSIPAHILRWIGLESGDEVSVQLNNDLSRGFSEGKENLPPTSFSIARVQIQVQLSALREFSKVSLCANSMADCFRQRFLNDVLNVGQCLLFEFTNSAGSNYGRRKRKCTEIEEMEENDDLEPLNKKGLAASAAGTFLKWTGFGGANGNANETESKYTIEAKILCLYQPMASSLNMTKSKYGVVKEGTQIILCPIAESGLCLYGDPAIISDSSNFVQPNAEPAKLVDKMNGSVAASAENEENATKSVKLKVQLLRPSPHSTNPDCCLIHQDDYNVATKIVSEEESSTKLPVTSTESCDVLITHKIYDKSNGNAVKERQIVWSVVNVTESAKKGERGKIGMSRDMIDQLKIEFGDEVTVQSLGPERTAKRIKIEFEGCKQSKKCPATFWGTHPEPTSFFHVKDIANSFRNAYLERNVNLNFSCYFIVEEEEIKSRMKKPTKTNLFDLTETNASCLKFQITEIEVGSVEGASRSVVLLDNTAAAANQPSTPNAVQIPTTTTENRPSSKELANPEFATLKKDTAIELKCVDSNLTIFGVEGQANNSLPKLLDDKSWDFHTKIGGMDEQLGEILRRAFFSRMISADCCKQMKLNHNRGILLYGPPGTGKTLIAREVAKALNSRKPKIINGSEIHSMWFGQSEKNVSSLFADAEREQALAGDQSQLHVIIIDELDALCPNRQFTVSSHRTEQRIVNTLLAKMDGVEQLNNILVIGMTNLMETIDPALLRPGRMEIKIHIGLPSEKGRREILEIHTNTMREANRLQEDVDLADLAKKTVNFSGAELEGLVRAAQSQAMQRVIKLKQQKESDRQQSQQQENGTTEMATANESAELELKICAADFNLAFEKDIQPAFGKGSLDAAQLKTILCHAPILWSAQVGKVLEKGAKLVEELRACNINTIGQSRLMLLNGPMQSGKTFLATIIAHRAGIPYIRLVTADSILDSLNNSTNCQRPTAFLNKLLSDCENSEFSCIIFDGLEQIIGYNECSSNWDHTILQKLAIILNRPPSKGKRILLLATSYQPVEWFEQMQLQCCLNGNRVELPAITKYDDVMSLFGAATKEEMAAAELNGNGEEREGAAKLFTKMELEAIGKAVAAELCGLGTARLSLTVKDLVDVVNWHAQQCLKDSSESDENEEMRFDKFKEKLLQLIAQKRGVHSTAHLSMYH